MKTSNTPNTYPQGEAFLAAIVDSSDDAIIGKTLDGTITSWNGGAEKIYGYPADEIIGKNISLLVPPDISNEVPMFLEQIKQGQKIRNFETLRLRKDKSVFTASITISPIVDSQGRIIGASTITRDITQRKVMDEHIKQLYKKEKVQRQKLQEEAKVKNLFIDILAHELRNPLTAVLSSSGILQDTPDISAEIRQRLAININSGAASLSKRLDDLLDVARFSKGTFELQKQPVDAKIFLEDVVDRFKPVLVKKNQNIELSISGELKAVIADQSRLEQVIDNLLSNASKYSAENSRIWITAKVKARKLIVEVKDEGVGIAAEDIDTLFLAYRRIGKTARTPGIGLGLYISKQIVNKHGGKIWVTSQVGQGSTFSFSIPLGKIAK